MNPEMSRGQTGDGGSWEFLPLLDPSQVESVLLERVARIEPNRGHEYSRDFSQQFSTLYAIGSEEFALLYRADGTINGQIDSVQLKSTTIHLLRRELGMEEKPYRLSDPVTITQDVVARMFEYHTSRDGLTVVVREDATKDGEKVGESIVLQREIPLIEQQWYDFFGRPWGDHRSPLPAHDLQTSS